jgi:hypothetical protein
MKNEQCPCCGQNQELVGAGALEAHYPPGGPRYGGMRSGSYCDGSGYTPDQARRWSALTPDQKREAVKSPWQEAS